MEGNCNFFVPRKKRFCRMTVRAGAKYCAEHEPKVSNPNEVQKDDPNLRIACPLDPKHSCYASKLEKHLKVCNAKQKDLPPYIKKNCNIPDDASGVKTDESSKRSLASVSEETLSKVVKIVERVYKDIIFGNISNVEPRECHPCVMGELEADGRGDGSRRHLLQTSSLIYLLDSVGLIQKRSCFVELGAGKGHLSYYLAKAVQDIPDSSVLLIDRAALRHKRDNKLRDNTPVTVERLRADIADLLLAGIPSVQKADSLVAVSKHLCGVATDLALRCMTQADVVEKSTGLVMATCCHHRCLWNCYVGKSFLEENGINQPQFDVICGLVSWATCGSGLSRERRANLNKIDSSKEAKKLKLNDEKEETNKNKCDIDNVDTNDVVNYIEQSCVSMSDTKINNLKEIEKPKLDDETENIENDICDKTIIENLGTNYIINDDKKSNIDVSDNVNVSQSNNDFHQNLNDESHDNQREPKYVSLSKHLGLSVRQREEIGFKAKAILDWGRLLFLREHKFNSKLCFYVEKSLSPENVCIVATKSN